MPPSSSVSCAAAWATRSPIWSTLVLIGAAALLGYAAWQHHTALMAGAALLMAAATVGASGLTRLLPLGAFAAAFLGSVTLRRGEVVMRDGAVQAEPGTGRTPRGSGGAR